MDRIEGGHPLIGRKFHVSCSVSGATRLMHRLGFAPQVPARRVAISLNHVSVSDRVNFRTVSAC
ncbi:winged helix-turn-helix domain-containing protein [Streptomyces sp. NBC_01614]|uniref:Winged helix-turn-helix domain-containing protein n=1 Tax=Streptomyces sp. NBC_00180 TaxID=2903632 RepID=A0AAU1I9J4_9ACTN